MSVLIQLPNGESAILKSDDEMTNREVKAMQQASRSAAAVIKGLEENGFNAEAEDAWKSLVDLPASDYDTIDLFQRTCVWVRLKSWTLDRPLPATIDEVDALPMAIYEPLTLAAVNVNFDPKFGIEGADDPKAVTAGSGN